MDIIIKATDKDGAVVIVNTKHYLKMIRDHFVSDFDTKVMKEIAKSIEKYKDNLTKKEKECLISFSHNTINFFMASLKFTDLN